MRGLWGSLAILDTDPACVLRQQTGWQRDESEGEPEESLGFGLRSSGGKQEARRVTRSRNR